MLAPPVPRRVALWLATVLPVLAGGAVGLGSFGSEAQGPGELQGPELADRVRLALAEVPATGAVVVAVHADRIVLLEAFGHTDQERTAEMAPEHLFHLGSAGAPLLGSLAVAMARAGTVALDTPVRSWAPELPPGIGRATLAQLLTHTAGLDDSPIVARRPGEAPRQLPPDEEIELLSDQVLVTDPGMIRSLSRYSLVVAGHVLAQAGGRPLAELLASYLLAPSGMTETVFSTEEALARGAEPGRTWSQSRDTPFAPAALPRDSLLAAHLRGWSTGADLAQLLTTWLRPGEADPGGAGPAEAFHLASLPVVADPTDPSGTLTLGLGWERTELGPWSEARAVGEGAGSTVVVRVLPEPGLAVAILTNGEASPLMQVSSYLLEELSAGTLAEESAEGGTGRDAEKRSEGRPAGGPSQAAAAEGLFPVPVVPAPEPVLDPGPEHAGRYRNGSEVLVLMEENGALFADMNVPVPLEIRIHGDGILTGHIADGREALRVRMVRDREGRVYLLLREKAFLLEEASP